MLYAFGFRLIKAVLLSLALLLVPVWGGVGLAQASAPTVHGDCPDHESAPAKPVPLAPHGTACQIACAALGLVGLSTPQGMALDLGQPIVLIPRPDTRPEMLRWPPPVKPPRA